MIFKILQKFGISAFESHRFLVSWGFRLLFQIGNITSWTVIISFFVEKFGIEYLGFLFIISAIILFISTMLSGFLTQKISSRKQLFGHLLGAFFCVILAAGFGNHEIEFFALLILAHSFFFSQVNITLARLQESFFSPDEAQKLLPKIETAITIGTILGAIFLLSILSVASTKAVLIVWAAVIVAMLSLLGNLSRLLNTIPNFSPPRTVFKNFLSETLELSKNIPFIKYLSLLIFLQTIVFFWIEIEFTRDLQMHMGPSTHTEVSTEKMSLNASLFDSAKVISDRISHEVDAVSSKLIAHNTLAHDLGGFHLIIGAFGLIVQLFITPFCLKKIGLIRSILTFMVLMFFGFFSFFYGGISWLRSFQHIFHSISQSAYHTSYYSIHSMGRSSVRLWLEGCVKPVAIILAVMIFWFLPIQTAWIYALIIVVLGIFTTIIMTKSFTQLSHKNINNESNIITKIHSIEVLAQKGHHEPALILGSELEKIPHPIIAKHILKTAKKVQDPKIVHSMIKTMSHKDCDDALRIDILDTLKEIDGIKKYLQNNAFGQHLFWKILSDLFENTNTPHIRKLAIINIFIHLPAKEIVPFFFQTMKTADERIKSVILRSCSIFRDPDVVFFLEKYLDDPSPRIRANAIIGMWKFSKNRDRLREIIDELIAHEDHNHLISGIYAIGEIQDDSYLEYLQNFDTEGDDEKYLHKTITLLKLGEKSACTDLIDILLGDNIKMSQSANYMLERIDDEEMTAYIHQKTRFAISHKVLEVLETGNLSHRHDLEQLAPDKFHFLKRLYRLSDKFDDLLFLEKYQLPKTF